LEIVSPGGTFVTLREHQLSVARGLCDAVMRLSQEHQTNVVVLSGGVFQNGLLLHDVKLLLEDQA
jgi:hydrogenase maturation factor HypF (carbamoyltransferase family)